MVYTAEDYNVTIFRGHVRDDGKVLWGKNPKLLTGLEWRTRAAYNRAIVRKKQGTKNVYHRNKDKLLQIKLASGCSVCGFPTFKYPKKAERHIGMVLEFDHIDRDAKFKDVSDLAGGSWVKIQAEVDKCRVLCKPCHAKHTGNQNRRDECYE